MSPRIILHPAIVVAIVGLLAPTTCFCRPIITQEPKSQTNVVGGTVTFVVEASGTAPLSYQWSFNSVGNPLPGATNAISVITNVQASHVGAYRVVVTNAEGSVTSRVASLEIESTFTKITTGPVVTDLGLSWGVTWADYDNDGLLDLDISNNDGPNFLYRNAGNGNFTRITTGPVGTELNGLSKTWGDFDNDGDLDVFTPGIRGMLHRIYRNNGDGSFTLLSANEVGSVALNGGNGREVSLGDYDNDGYLDLFIASGLGFANELYHGSVGGQFEKITTGPIPQDGDDSIQGGWSDYDDDGDLDLLVAAHGSKFFYQNGGDGSFTKLEAASVGDILDGDGGHGLAWGDYDNDGDLDVFVAGHRDLLDNVLNALYQNDGNGKFERMTSDQVGAIVTGSMGNSPVWADYDNDGFLDLFVTTRGNHDDLSKKSSLYHSNGDGTFSQVFTGSLANDVAFSWGAAWGDFDNDGFMDLAVANGGSFVGGLAMNNFLYRNDGNSNRWLKLKLEGTISNRSAIGAKIRVKATIQGTAVWQMREISGGEGFWSQGDLRPNFGLGDAAVAESVIIEWPSGIIQAFKNVAANQMLTVTEPAQNLIPEIEEIELRDTEILLTCRGTMPGRGYRVERSVSLGESAEWLDSGVSFARSDTPVQVTIPSDPPALANGGNKLTLTSSESPQFFRLTEFHLLTITTQPERQSTEPGGDATFSVSAIGEGLLTYQWSHNGTNIDGAVASSHTLTNAGSADRGEYSVVVSDYYDSVSSDPARLVVLVAPLIVEHPQPHIVTVGQSVTFSVTVTNTSTLPVTYRWRKNGATQNPIQELDEYTSTLTITDVQLSDDGKRYDVIVSNEANPGGVLSDRVLLTVQ